MVYIVLPWFWVILEMWLADVLLRLQSNRLHNGYVMGTEESGRYGEVGVLYDNFLGEYMFFLC